MADTVNVGEVAVEIVARTERMQKGMQNAAASVQSFSKTASASIDTFSFKTEGLKKAAQTAGGAVSSSMGNAAGAIVQFGPVVGTAVAAMQLFNNAAENGKKAASGLAAEYQKVSDVFKSLGQASGAIASAGSFSAPFQKEIDKANASIASLQTQMQEVEADLILRARGFAEPFKAMIDSANVAKRSAREWMEIMRPLDEAQKEFQAASFNAEIGSQSGSLEQMQAKYEAVAEYANSLLDTLDKLPEGGTAFNTVLSQWEKNFIAAKTLMEQIEEKQKDIANAYISGQDAMTAAFKAHKEQEKKDYEDSQSDVLDLMGMMKKKKPNAKDFVDLGFATQLDTSRVSASAMTAAASKVMKVSDPALQTTNQLLTEVKNKVGNATARTSK